MVPIFCRLSMPAAGSSWPKASRLGTWIAWASRWPSAAVGRWKTLRVYGAPLASLRPVYSPRPYFAHIASLKASEMLAPLPMP
ncbi:MAG: hypothetical protein R2708_04855 [Vicinamibacterales bacterium]